MAMKWATWVEFDGTFIARKVWDERADQEGNDSSIGHEVNNSPTRRSTGAFVGVLNAEPPIEWEVAPPAFRGGSALGREHGLPAGILAQTLCCSCCCKIPPRNVPRDVPFTTLDLAR